MQRNSLILWFGVILLLGGAPLHATSVTEYIQEHRNDTDLLNCFTDKVYFSEKVRSQILKEYLTAEYEALNQSGAPPAAKVRAAGLRAVPEYLHQVTDPSSDELNSIGSILLDKMGKGALTFPGQKRYAVLVVKTSPASDTIVIDGKSVYSPIGQFCLLAGSHSLEVRKDSYQACKQNVQLNDGERRTVECTLKR
jgi:PEGA domain